MCSLLLNEYSSYDLSTTADLLPVVLCLCCCLTRNRAKMPQLSKADLDIINRKHELTLKLRNEYLKQYSNPFRHATGEGGTVFDTGLARFQAMRVSHFEHFKPTGHAFRTGMLAVVLPIVVYAWALKNERDGREHKYRTGQVAYKDRRFKFI